MNDLPRVLVGVVVVSVIAMLTQGVVAMSSGAPGDSAASGANGAGESRTVLVTGANRGLGLEFARQYAAAGWKVIATARDVAAAKELKALGDGVEILPLDVADAKSVEKLATTLQGRAIDLLVNNAGVGAGDESQSGLADVDIANFERIMQVNFIGPVRVTQALLPHLKAVKVRTIVSISSGLGSIAGNRDGGFYGYRESKAALDMFMRSLAAELKDDGFICVPMSPGWVKTDMGGPGAPLTPEQSISGMRKVIDGLKAEDSGKFWSHDGTNPAW